jgi:hypothetical protein
MKHIAVIVVAVMSLLLAIPLSHSARKIEPSIAVKHSISIKPVIKSSKVSLASSTAIVASTVPTPLFARGCSTYQSTFEQYSWNISVAMAICQAESSGNPYAVSATNDYGLMQIHDDEVFNPYQNIATAYSIYTRQGWDAWTTFREGLYLQYL